MNYFSIFSKVRNWLKVANNFSNNFKVFQIFFVSIIKKNKQKIMYIKQKCHFIIIKNI